MAKFTTLKDRIAGGTLYPRTLAEAVSCGDGKTVGTHIERLKRVNVFTSEPLTPGNFPDVGVYTREQLKMDLFIDMWNEAWKIGGRIYGKYDPDNAPDAEHPFMGNDVWMTYNEALAVLRNHDNILYGQITFSKARTLIPFVGNIEANLSGVCNNCPNVETVRILNYYIVNNGADPDKAIIAITNTRDSFVGCRSLKEIRGILKMSTYDQMGCHFYGSLGSCSNLETLWLHSICLNINLRTLKQLKLECIQYMIEHAANTAPITITLHPEAFARLTDELVELASSKNITLATA